MQAKTYLLRGALNEDGSELILVVLGKGTVRERKRKRKKRDVRKEEERKKKRV